MLGVLDGAVLVVSAVEGVQAQTRVLMRTLQRLRIPTLIFVNKIDRARRAGRARAARHRREADAGHRRDGVGRCGLGTRGARFTPYARRPTAASPRGWPRCSPTTTRRCWPRTSTTRRPVAVRGLRRALAAQTAAGAGASGVLRLGDHRRRRRRADGRHRRAAARRRGRRRRPGCRARCSRSSAGRPARRSPTCGCSPARCARATGCVSAGDDASEGDRASASSTAAAPSRARRSRAGQIGQAVGAGERPDRRRDRPCRAPADRPAALRAADAGDRRRARPRRPTGARCTSRSPSSPSRTR